MQIRMFRISAAGEPEAEEALNRFLRSVRVLTLERQFVPDGQHAYWALCVEYLESAKARAEEARGRERVDYKQVLSPADFALFARLRELRKAVATEEGVPAYAVATNEQLAEVARCRPGSTAALRQVEGIGDAKAEKYGDAILALVRDAGSPALPPGAPAGGTG